MGRLLFKSNHSNLNGEVHMRSHLLLGVLLFFLAVFILSCGTKTSDNPAPNGTTTLNWDQSNWDEANWN